jgi:hypothetical protein
MPRAVTQIHVDLGLIRRSDHVVPKAGIQRLGRHRTLPARQMENRPRRPHARGVLTPLRTGWCCTTTHAHGGPDGPPNARCRKKAPADSGEGIERGLALLRAINPDVCVRRVIWRSLRLPGALARASLLVALPTGLAFPQERRTTGTTSSSAYVLRIREAHMRGQRPRPG